MSVNKKSRKEHLDALKDEQRTMIFYEAPHKLPNTLKDLYEHFGERRLTICRELTKLHEEIIRTTTKEAFENYFEGTLKGEIVLVLEGAEKEIEKKFTLEEAVALAEKFMAEGKKTSDAAKQAASVTGFKKNDIYKELMQ